MFGCYIYVYIVRIISHWLYSRSRYDVMILDENFFWTTRTASTLNLIYRYFISSA